MRQIELWIEGPTHAQGMIEVGATIEGLKSKRAGCYNEAVQVTGEKPPIPALSKPLMDDQDGVVDPARDGFP